MVDLKDMTLWDIRLKYNMSVRVFYALVHSSCENVMDIINLTEEKILPLGNVGKVTVAHLKTLQAEILADLLNHEGDL